MRIPAPWLAPSGPAQGRLFGAGISVTKLQAMSQITARAEADIHGEIFS